LPARGIAFSDGETTFTVNLPTPDIRQSGLTFSIKSQYEGGSGPNFITVVHNSVNLLTTYELDEAEGSIDFLWDGYEWTYGSLSFLRSKPSRRLTLPGSTGTLALNPMISTGDLFVGGTFGAPARLALGTASQQLRVNSGATGLEYFTSQAIVSNTTGITGADAVTNIVSLTQAEYNAIGSPNATTLFLITDP
jgi:hypothetical protein